MSDKLTRFIFDNHSVRGEVLRFAETYAEAIKDRSYPAPAATLIGEMLAACSLLTATLKFEGEISLQIQSEGFIKYAVVHATHKQALKALLRINPEQVAAPTASFSELFKKGYLVITITPKEGERYQGIVGLEQESLAACLEDYFAQSEQLPTKIKLFAKYAENDANVMCAGLLLQALPTDSETSMDKDNESMQHLSMLADTLSKEEAFTLQEHELLYRLFNQEVVRVLEGQAVEYRCDCSKARTAQALRSIEHAQLDDIIKEDGQVTMNCHFCNHTYRFDEVDIANIKAGKFSFLEASDKQH